MSEKRKSIQDYIETGPEKMSRRSGDNRLSSFHSAIHGPLVCQSMCKTSIPHLTIRNEAHKSGPQFEAQ